MKKIIAVILAAVALFSISVTALAAPSANLISKEEAKAIALEHAGYKEDEVKFEKVSLEFDDGRYEYEIDFRAEGNLEFDYTINAENGNIVEYDRDYDAPDRVKFFNVFAFLKNFFAKIANLFV